MNRRSALKTLLLASGGTLTLPSWTMAWNEQKLPDFDSIFTLKEQALIRATVDTILPDNGAVGGVSLGVDRYLNALYSDCYEQDAQNEIKAGLLALNDHALKELNQDFEQATQSQRENILLAFERGSSAERDFYQMMRSRSIHGFRTSEKVMVDYHDYVMMPGFYDGNVDIEG